MNPKRRSLLRVTGTVRATANGPMKNKSGARVIFSNSDLGFEISAISGADGAYDAQGEGGSTQTEFPAMANVADDSLTFSPITVNLKIGENNTVDLLSSWRDFPPNYLAGLGNTIEVGFGSPISIQLGQYGEDFNGDLKDIVAENLPNGFSQDYSSGVLTISRFLAPSPRKNIANV